MVFWVIVGILFVLSFFGAVVALKKELSKPKEISRVEEELAREKILFKA